MEKERSLLSHPFVGSEHLLLSLLKSDKYTIFLLSDYGVTYDTFFEKLKNVVGECKKNVDFNLYTPLLKRVINFALEEAKINKEKVNSKYILSSLIEEGEGVAVRILLGMDVDLDDLYKTINEKNKDSELNLSFGKNLNETVCMDEKVIGRDKEIQYIIETLLRKKKNNPLLIGDAGVGKSAIVEEFARMINLGVVPKKLKNSCIISVDMASIVAGTKYRGEFEEKLNKIIEISQKNSDIILFIDEIHTITNAGGAEGAIGAGDIFKPYLARGDIKVIGATTTDEYNKYIAKDKALSRRFEINLIKEPSRAQTVHILNNIKGEYEKFHNVKISNNNINQIVKLADEFIFNKKNPDKSIDFLDSVASYVQMRNDNSETIDNYLVKLSNVKKEKNKCVCDDKFEQALKFHEEELILENKISKMDDEIVNVIKTKDILKVLESKTNMPVLLNKKTLISNINYNLDSKFEEKNCCILKKFIIDKFDDLSKLKTLFVYGDSVDVVKKVRKILEGINYIKINGEDFMSSESISKLLGVSAGYSGYNDNNIFSSLNNNPYALIHVYNFDKCADNIKNLINEIIKEEKVTNSKGEDINFNHSLLVVSSLCCEKSKVGFDNKGVEDKKCSDFDYVITHEKKEILV